MALQLCLGGSSRVTGRGSNQKDHIREGSPGPAIIRVKLRNQGSDAYQPEKYGRNIIVERRITKTGASGYRMISSLDGKEVSHEKRELENILRAFNIYVDNPCCVLTQEETKKFVHGTDKDKYIFFLKVLLIASLLNIHFASLNLYYYHGKASGLQFTYEDLSEATNTLEKVKEEMPQKNERLDELKRVAIAAQEQLTALRKLESYEQTIDLCNLKLLWLAVNEKTSELVEVEEDIGGIEASLQKELKLLEDASGNDGSTRIELDRLAAEIQRIQSDADIATMKAQECHDRLSSTAQKKARCNANIATANGNISSMKERYRNCRETVSYL